MVLLVIVNFYIHVQLTIFRIPIFQEHFLNYIQYTEDFIELTAPVY